MPPPKPPPRLYVERPLVAGDTQPLPDGAARHVQVLRLQPGAALTLFDGRGGESDASVVRIGRSEVLVTVGAHHAVERELALQVTLALGMPANERMDGVVEKATELGVAAIQPLICERSVLRLAGERATRKVAHWHGVAQAACEQSGRTRVPRIEPVRTLADWLAGLPTDAGGQIRWLLSLSLNLGRSEQPLTRPPAAAGAADAAALLCLSGPEGGLTDTEEAAARLRGFKAVSLGPRVLRADTAPLAVLAHLALAEAAAA